MSEPEDRGRLVRIADYQFGPDAGEALFAGELRIERSKSGRPRQVHAPAGRLVSLGGDGRFTLGLAGGRRVLSALPAPAGRVVVGDESEPFVREGKNVFAKFVAAAGPEIRPGDEVPVVHEDGELLAVGRAELSAGAMDEFETGMAVKVREGCED
ncbi:PUA domain-containing protein [Halalkalicoccus jeotgali]|uniref:RNA binding protein n=1 Tax=Halalkalicoccus jeotgali (strain DSM 18796 / CECT 7217 / JCM 14584 / KCTC 4019 / B3) TaxID=795797 RepID=D8J8A2_HALJB|nr:PUA domain-containing protein [Halalkalicoccus jeotgali]ADJ16148.1 putative RNA binding protein [Halalkalicoccus jeotgali B3]ELY37577.1 putative RNA binding protein [Halalkalicoccus jeotgali B3]